MKSTNIDLLKKIKLLCFDFDGVFTDNKVYVSQDGKETVLCYRSDGIGLEKLKKLNIVPFIISTEKNEVVAMRAAKLKINCIHGVNNKANEVIKLAKSLNLELNEVGFVGNDINDIPALKIVGCPIGVADAFPEIDNYIILKTNKNGGCGAVREVCDLVVRAKNSSVLTF